MAWDFDTFMNRYENLIRDNVRLEAEKNTYLQKYNTLNVEVTKLREKLLYLKQKMDQGNNPDTDRFVITARRVYQDNPDMNKIDMIKEVRGIMGYGLKEAKDAIDRVFMENGRNIYA